MADTKYHRSPSDDDDSDDDDDSRPVIRQSPPEKPPEKWDVFETTPPEDETLALEEKQLYQYTIRALKFLTYIVVFSLVLASAVASKLAVVLMTSQLKNGTERAFCHNIPFRSRRITISGEETIMWHWALFFCFAVPEVATLVRSLRIVWFKSPEHPNIGQLLVPMFFEICHTIGLGLFVFYVLPGLNAVFAVMLGSSFCVLPGILKLLSRNPTRYKEQPTKAAVLMLLDLFSILMQVAGFVLWSFVFRDEHRLKYYWMYPLSAFLVSFGWWENFVSKDSKIFFIRKLGEMRPGLEKTRYHAYKYIAPLKIALLLATMCFCIYLNEEMEGNPVKPYFTKFYNATMNTHRIYSSEINETVSYATGTMSALPSELGRIVVTETSRPETTWSNSFRNTLLIQCIITYFCYATAKFACKICIQSFSFAFPLTLSTPITVAVLLSFCGARDHDVCYGRKLFPPYLFWDCPDGSFREQFVTSEYGWVWILLLISQTWIVFHIWFARAPKLASSETLFCTPFFNALFIDQDIMMNRKRDLKHDTLLEEHAGLVGPGADEESSSGSSDVIEHGDKKEKPLSDHPRIITCATMWHENDPEMCTFFKSVLRLDADQCTKRVAREKFGVSLTYYDYETHIYFDDAFKKVDLTPDGKLKVKSDKPGEEPKREFDANGDEILLFDYQVNDFVISMMKQIEKAATIVHETTIKIADPIRYPTPYGGRLEYTLPGKTKLYVHLKDKNKIRHRKRWSQCMYMYYLLGHKIMATDYSNENKDILARNTYLLALDGDIDFQPEAVHLLVDRMKINERLGAACGRIHPIGEGPMVWYQKFEYAIGHWLQKATEHMIGCVLCSPGCFSLFRAEALMEKNVMKTYTTEPTEARHYVQYDQGEDRWLCTLMLQEGWRVEYSAASDAFTHAPEGFNEFYNQRRRWVPSTMANILDLLVSYKRTIKNNKDISFPYILYQMIMMGGSILGPGTIFLMLVGAFNAAFSIDMLTCLYMNAIPLGIFIIACYTTKQKTQLAIAQLLSVVYALVMVAVLIALALQVSQDGLFAPSSLFLVAISMSFIIAAIVHPMEFDCLPHGLVYYITIPSMYLLLIVYSLFNLNDITWGTRENPAEAAEQKAADVAAAATNKKEKKGGITSWIPGLTEAQNNAKGSFEFSFAGLFKLMCCVQEKHTEDLEGVLVRINKDLEVIRETVQAPKSKSEEEKPIAKTADQRKKIAKQQKRNPLINPFWNDDPRLGNGKTEFIDSVEVLFWIKMIGEYLTPIDANKETKDKISKELKDLRNKTVGAFFMFNAVFVTAMFLLQMNKDQLYFDWPLGTSYNMTLIQEENKFEVYSQHLQLEPLGLLFVGFYAIILVVQFIAMLLHRFGTFMHIMAATKVGLFRVATRDGAEVDEHADQAEQIRYLSKMNIKKANDDIAGNEKKYFPGAGGRRPTAANLLYNQQIKRKQFTNLDEAMNYNLEKLQEKDPRMARRLTKAAIAPNASEQFGAYRRQSVAAQGQAKKPSGSLRSASSSTSSKSGQLPPNFRMQRR